MGTVSSRVGPHIAGVSGGAEATIVQLSRK
jgi:hypothetical protein